MDNVDLERTGTRPRRPGSKRYSIDLPSPESKTNKNSVNQFFQSRFFLLLACCLSALFLFFNYHNSIVTTPKELQFNDTSQYTDYALLEQLLNQDALSFIPQPSSLPQETFNGQTLEKLLKLPLATPSITVIVKTHPQLPQQIQAVLSQTIVPDKLLIVGDDAMAQSLQDGKRVQWIEDTTSIKVAQEAQTDFVWMLEPNVIPGKRYLEYVLRVSSVYNNYLWGTEAMQEGCVWSSETSQAVEQIGDSWIVKRSWLPLLEEGDISHALFKHGGILSALLPSDPLNQEYWGNIKRDTLCDSVGDWKATWPEDSVLMYMGSKEMQKMACEWIEKKRPLVIVTEEEMSECVADQVTVFKVSNTEYVLRMVDLVKPKLVISDTPIDLVSHIPVIQLAPENIAHTSWMADLPIDLLAEWNSISIKIMVTVDKKNDNFKRLLDSLDSAYFMGDTVDLTFLMDYTTDRPIHQTANHYHWSHGPKYLRHRIASAHKMAQFAESWYPSSNQEYAILLDTELELSPHFYAWAKQAVLMYRSSSNHLFGISLYRPTLIETDPLGRRLFTERPPSDFLMQWPSYSGALFFPQHWREFHDYMTTRLADREGLKMQEVHVPESRSNEWKLSWRKYFEELVYLRSYVMLYPAVSLSSRHVELRKKSQREKYGDALSLYEVPLMTQINKLPAWNDLPVMDFYGHQSSIKEMKERGGELQDAISACLPNQEIDFDPSDLLCPFARIVTVKVKNENDPVKELELKQADVYV